MWKYVLRVFNLFQHGNEKDYISGNKDKRFALLGQLSNSSIQCNEPSSCKMIKQSLIGIVDI